MNPFKSSTRWIAALVMVAALAAPATAAKKKATKKAAAAVPTCAERPCGPFKAHVCDCYVGGAGERCFDSIDKCNADAAASVAQPIQTKGQ